MLQAKVARSADARIGLFQHPDAGADVVRGGYRLLRANAAGTAVELPHPPGQAIIIHKVGAGCQRLLQAAPGSRFGFGRQAAIPQLMHDKGLDFWYALRHNKKQGAALFLFRTHLQGLYACLPNREEKLLQ